MMTLLLGFVGLVRGICKKMKIMLDSYTGSLVHLGVNKKEKIMKSRSFKTRKEFVDYLQGYGKYTGKPKIVKVKPMTEAEYWEQKAEIYYGI